jgi:GGDEF domain-containing protein
MNVRSPATVKSLVVPGGILLLATAVVLHGGWMSLTLPGLVFVDYAALTAGLLLAWRFHSSRIFFALLVLFLAQQAIERLSGGSLSIPTAGHTTLEVVGVLLPLNFAFLALTRERGFTPSAVVSLSLVLFVQAVIVAVIFRDQEPWITGRAHRVLVSAPLPDYVWVLFAAVSILLLIRFFLLHKPAESALLWSQAAFFLGLHFTGVGRTATAYFAVAALILAASIIETSYLLAYHDELTSLPSRRSFNDALQRLQSPYSIAALDIDHFKRFNDTYGHDTGDQVLRLVAGRMARVSGGGQAYRFGGEEFAILFPGKTANEVVDHLEQLRADIEESSFHVRGPDRRQAPRGPERRNRTARRAARDGRLSRQPARARSSARLSVTVSIGVAASEWEQDDPARILQAADKALYRAKNLGRNRVEISSSSRRARARNAEIA